MFKKINQFVRTKTVNLKVMQVYAPTSNYGDEDIEIFYKEVNKAISEYNGRL